MTVTLRPYQEALLADIFSAWQQGHKYVLAVSPTGCHAPGTPILMFDGTTKKVENVSVGDILMGPDSTPRNVLRLISGREQMYRITPVKGDSFVVNENHVLSLMTTNEGKERGVTAGEIINIPVKNYLTRSKYYKHVHKLYKTGVDFAIGEELPVPAYVVGAMLGDGSVQTYPIICSMDSEIHDEVNRFALSLPGVKNHTRQKPDNKSWMTYYSVKNGTANPFISKLRDAGIWGMRCETKDIPHRYLTASREDRFEMLAGLMDTDGSQGVGSFDFISKSEKLANSTVYLARSLGLRAGMKPCVKSSQTGYTDTYYRVTISGDTHLIPCRLAHKKAAPRRQIKNPMVTGFSVEAVGEGDFYGFTLDGDHLYLTGDFFVHHNSGKAFSLATVVQRNAEPTCVMVHRGELVAQLSETLATLGITHRIIASKSTVAMCVSRHVKKFGRSFHHPQSPIGVASVQTLVKRLDKLEQWLSTIRLMVPDEAHHSTAAQYRTIFEKLHPDCKMLGVTATPDRCDRKSLARVQGGIFDAMVEGPTPRWLIEQGFLAPYKYYAPPPSFTVDEDDVSKNTGEVKPDVMRKKSHESRIVGDIVKTYQEKAPGKQAIAFVVDIETAQTLAQAFNDAGIRAAAVSGKTPDAMRVALMAKFEARQLQVLVNVDLFDEGLDIPGVECVIMGRPTMSLGKFRQQVGRALRPVYMAGMRLDTAEQRVAAIAAGPKPFAILIDHVENWKVHKFPDSERAWSLIRPDGVTRKKDRDDEIPLRSCIECFQPYEAVYKACPHCGHKPEPASRSAPEMVDGDIIEFSPELIAQLSGEVSRVDGAPQIPPGVSPIVEASIKKRWRERQEAQAALRHTIALWAGMWRDKGATDSESYRRFFHTFKSDVLTAQALGVTEAKELHERIAATLPRVHLPGVG